MLAWLDSSWTWRMTASLRVFESDMLLLCVEGRRTEELRQRGLEQKGNAQGWTLKLMMLRKSI